MEQSGIKVAYGAVVMAERCTKSAGRVREKGGSGRSAQFVCGIREKEETMAMSRWEIASLDNACAQWTEHRTDVVHEHDVTTRCPPA